MNIVVTGATKGIGWAIIEKFAEAGFNVAFCSRTTEDLEHRTSTLEAIYPDIRVIAKKVDMRSKEEVKAFAAYILKSWGTIDVLVNNAGVFLPGEIAMEEDGALETMMETNLYSAYHFTRALLPSMIEKKSGYIFNMCSIASKIAYPNGGSYSISKFALLGFSKVIREELKDKGIRVSAILPGATWSNSWKGVDLPEDRLMQSSDIAKAVFAAYSMSDSAVMEEIILRPQLGDL